MFTVVTSLWVASATTVSRSRERLKKLPWVPPETLIGASYIYQEYLTPEVSTKYAWKGTYYHSES